MPLVPGMPRFLADNIWLAIWFQISPEYRL